MKDSEFIELLNLYLDHEISAADAARLEAEVQGNPSRRRIYQDYCRMQKACRMLAEDFVSEPTPETSRKVIAFNAQPRRSVRAKVYALAGGLTAAAACVALVFVGQSPSQKSTPLAAPVAQTTPTVAAPTVAAVATTTAAPVTRGGIERRSSSAFSLNSNLQAASLVSAANGQNDARFAWLNDVRLTPIQVPAPADPLRFQVTPALSNESRTFTSGNRPAPADIPHISIRFER
ncbi:zf-HC2 domain-containing protein [Opitutus sp. ER46]|uniref:anti-sigma factor family protein n=1 Tax=Opitutus sp. ER46 TaxID=2161864 RepID=UPI000D31D2F6|nr:zf-HC2 domain-containing protein [Opitutus sp. ER46]PTX99064.1 hypothetical protein DB354_03350 [Opitutus sp. ER46]